MEKEPRPTTVLAVDDNPEILVAVESYLIGFDYEVETATSAPEALGRIRNGDVPTVLFSDIVMPGAIDGIDLAKIVRQEFPNIGVLLMTGWSYDDAHGFPVLTKPFRLNEVTDWIERFLTARN